MKIILSTYKDKVCYKCKKLIPRKSMAKRRDVFDKAAGGGSKALYFHWGCLENDITTVAAMSKGRAKVSVEAR
jgi:hypothetical protein